VILVENTIALNTVNIYF